MKPSKPLRERFLTKFHQAGDDECWNWIGARFVTGYGAIGSGVRPSKALYAHRVAWEFAFGSIPDGLYVCHRCDNRQCVNPGHLFLATGAENQVDMASKFRAKAKLAPSAATRIREMRKGGATLRQIADAFGISQSTVSSIVHRQIWRHVA